MNNIKNTKHQSFIGHPKPLQGLFLAELWERFSYYGIRPLLILYMSAMTVNGGLGLDYSTATAIVGLFAGSIYLVTLFGGWLADHWLGQARAVWYGSLIMAAGHFSIAITPIFDHFFFYFGLILIVIGTGLFKTCISVIVGTLYAANDSRRDAGYSVFYIGINLGAFIAPLLSSFLIKDYGWYYGFGISGIGMLLSLIIFRCIAIPQLNTFHKNQNKQDTWNQVIIQKSYAPKVAFIFGITCFCLTVLVYSNIIQLDPVLMATYLTIFISVSIILYFAYLILFSNTTDHEKKQLVACFILLVFAALFWSAFEQNLTSIHLFAQDFTYRYVGGFEVPTLWFYSLNGLLIFIFAPLLTLLWNKLAQSNNNPSHVAKFIIALILAAIAFGMMIIASQSVISSGGALVSPIWLISTIFLLTIGEICLSPVGLSTMSKLAPTMLRGQIMGLWFTTTALGNLMASLIAGQALQNNLQDLPIIFMRCVLVLLIGSVILYTLKNSILSLMSHEKTFEN